MRAGEAELLAQQLDQQQMAPAHLQSVAMAELLLRLANLRPSCKKIYLTRF
jgi:hypothetical protein